MPTAPLEFVSIDILGPLRKTKDGNELLLVMSDRFTKLTAVVPLKRITDNSVARAFVDNWVYKYGPPAILLSDNGKQVREQVFHCYLPNIRHLNCFHHYVPPTCERSSQALQQNSLICNRRYVSEELDDWDQYCNALTFAYNCQVHPSVGFSPFELVLTRPPCYMAVEKLLNDTPEE